MKQYFPTNAKVAVENYPYGYKKTTAYFSLEWKKGKGFRTVFQTINPANGKLNKEKYSTYSPVIAMYKDERGHVHYISQNPHGAEAVNETALFLDENYSLFTKEQIKDICAYLFSIMKADSYARKVYCNTNFQDLVPFITDAVNAINEGFSTGENIFGRIHMDIAGMDALKDENFNPFKVTEYESI
jgi:hypothetical protein